MDSAQSAEQLPAANSAMHATINACGDRLMDSAQSAEQLPAANSAMHANIDACGDCLMDGAQSTEQLPAAAVIKRWSREQTWELEDMLPAWSILDAQLHLPAQYWMLNFTCLLNTKCSTSPASRSL
jgi:hypothetical protein